LKGIDVGRRGRTLTVAAILVGAGVAAALVVAGTGPNLWRPPTIGGEGSGTVTLAPVLVEPREPDTTPSPSNDQPTTATDQVADGPAGGAASSNLSDESLEVSVGSVEGLFPGHRVEIGVTYVNPYSFPIAIDAVNVTSTGTAGCSARYLRHGERPVSRLRLPSGASLASTVEVGMRRSAPDACQGVRFAVRVGVTAVKL
jgi:hypothetical protein